MKAAILGAGAMGSLVGAHLKKGGAEVYFVDVDEKHMKAVAEKGITMELEGEAEPQTVFVDGAETSGDPVGVCDAVIVLVKCYDTEKAVETNQALFGKDTAVITLQNGVGGADLLLKHFDGDHVGLGVLKSSANIIEPGRILGRARFPDSPKGIYFSPYRWDAPYRSLYDELEKLLTAGGMPAECNEHTEEFVWDKLCSNVMINGIAALLQLSGEHLGSHEDGVLLMNELARETCEVAAAKGIKNMDAAKYIRKPAPGLNAVDKVKTPHYVSMVIDSFHKRRTEIDFMNGAVVREGKKYGIPTPYNETVCRLVRVMQDTYHLKYGPPKILKRNT